MDAACAGVQVNSSTQPTLYDCWTTCDVRRSCFSFTYTANTGTCQLYNGIGPIYRQLGTNYYAFSPAVGANCELLTYTPTSAPTSMPSAAPSTLTPTAAPSTRRPTKTPTPSPTRAPTAFPGTVRVCVCGLRAGAYARHHASLASKGAFDALL